MKASTILTIARYCWLEAVRTRFLWMLIGLLLVLLMASCFPRALAITESARIQLGFFAAFARIATVLLVCLHVAATLVRQFNDKETDLLLAMDLTRTDYLVGRYLGYAAICVLSALIVSAFVAALAPSVHLLAWGLSLALELMLMAAVTLFFVVSFAQIAPAVLFVAAFYLLARSISVLQLVSHSPVFAAGDSTVMLGQKAIDAVALLLPRLDQFAPSAWLLDAGTTPALASIFLQAGAYIPVVIAAGLFDLHRKAL